jgi:hypothetical protein
MSLETTSPQSPSSVSSASHTATLASSSAAVRAHKHYKMGRELCGYVTSDLASFKMHTRSLRSGRGASKYKAQLAEAEARIGSGGEGVCPFFCSSKRELRRHTGDDEGGSNCIRSTSDAQGSGDFPSFFTQCTDDWIVFIFPYLPLQGTLTAKLLPGARVAELAGRWDALAGLEEARSRLPASVGFVKQDPGAPLCHRFSAGGFNISVPLPFPAQGELVELPGQAAPAKAFGLKRLRMEPHQPVSQKAQGPKPETDDTTWAKGLGL